MNRGREKVSSRGRDVQVFGLIWRHRTRIAAASIASALSAMSSVFVISFINTEIAGGHSVSYGERVAVFLVALLAMVVMGVVSQYFLSSLNTTVICQLVRAMVDRVLDTAFERLEQIGGHQIYAVLTKDVTQVSVAFMLAPNFVFHSLTIALCILYLVYLSTKLFLIFVVLLTVAVIVARFFMVRGAKYAARQREYYDDLFGCYQTLVDGNKELILNAKRREHFTNQRVRTITGKIRRVDLIAQIYWSINNNWGNMILFLAVGAVVFASSVFLQVSRETIVGYVLVVMYLIGPISFLLNTIEPISNGIVSVKKIERLDLGGESNPVVSPGTASSEEPAIGDWNKIRVTDLRFQYEHDGDSRAFTIGPVDLELRKGEIVFLTGGNGSGKSTFAKIITGLYTKYHGHIQLDDRTVSSENLAWYRRHFATVFSDYCLFEHILDSNGDIVADERTTAFLKKMELDHKTDPQNGRISTTALSQGQKKRIALLLAYMTDPQLYVLDEWAADQDQYFRNYFYNEWLPQQKEKGKTMIVISHDQDYYHAADRIYRFEQGKLIEQGAGIRRLHQAASTERE